MIVRDGRANESCEHTVRVLPPLAGVGAAEAPPRFGVGTLSSVLSHQSSERVGVAGLEPKSIDAGQA